MFLALCHRGHVTSTMLINFHFLVLKSLHINLVEKGTVGFEKNKF